MNFLGYAHWFMSMSISQLKNNSIPVHQNIYDISIVAKYLDTITIKEILKFHDTTLTHYMIFTKENYSTIYEQVEVLSREFNIHYRACVGSLIYILSKRVYLCFSVQRLVKFSSNPGKVNFEGLVHWLIYIRYSKNLGFRYYAKIEDASISDLLRQAGIRNESQLMVFSHYICQYCIDNGRITGASIVFYQGGPIYYFTHVPGSIPE